MKKRITLTPVGMPVSSSPWQPRKALLDTHTDPPPVSFIRDETILHKILYRSKKSNASSPKVRENQRVINKSVYLVLLVDMSGQKELLGIWITQREGARVLALGARLRCRTAA